MAVNFMRVHPQWGVFDESAERQEGYSQPLWNVEAHKIFRTVPDSKAKTMVEVLERSKANHGHRRCAGEREVVKAHMVPDSSGKLWEKLELRNEYSWLTYQEYYARVLSVARGFAFLGVEPKSKVVIYAETQRDWMVAAFAAWNINAQVVTIYATLGPDGATHGINETEATTVVVDARLLKTLQKILPKCRTVKNIVTLSACDAETSHQVEEGGTKVHSLDDLVEKGRTWSFSPSLPTSEDVAVIMYTSGTTGAPKGVVISHGNIVATAAGVEHDLKGLITHEDVYMAYLPLAHIMEMCAECAVMGLGASLGFGNPSTLLSAGDASKKLFTEPSKEALRRNAELATIRPQVAYSIGDAPLLRPTFMVFPPAVLDKMYQNVSAKFREKKIGWVLRRGLQSSERRAARGRNGANWMYNAVFKKTVQSMVGGRVKAIISGSAPLSPEVQHFAQAVFAAPVRQGYGLTETCAGSCVAFWGDQSDRSVGPPTVTAHIRLADWPEGLYMVSDKDKEGVMMPRGEVLIGGPGVTKEYYVNPNNPNTEIEKKNKEDWVTIGGVRYFRTGDIGQVTSSGTLQIIDRKKDLWKGPNGEYVALAKVEQALTLCPFVQLPMAYGRTGGNFPVALICPQKAAILDLAKELQIQGDFEALCKNERIVERVAQACTEKCKEKKLLAFEIPQKVALISELWTPENELLTAAMKLKRPSIAMAHKAEIDNMYAATSSA